MRKYSVSIRGHRTSVSLEPAFLDALEKIAQKRGMALSALITEVDSARDDAANLSSALRLYVLDHLQRQSDA